MALDRLPDAIRPILQAQRADLHTAYPAAVVEIDGGTCTLEIGVREVLEAQDEDDEDAVSTYPRISGVPIVWPSAGSWVLTFPVAVGTTGALICTASDLSKWLETGQVSDPGVSDRHTLGGFFVPGLRHSRNRIQSAAGALTLGDTDGITLVIGSAAATLSGRLEVDGNTDAAALASKMLIELGKIAVTLASLTVGDQTFATPYTAPVSVSTIASAKIKTGS